MPPFFQKNASILIAGPIRGIPNTLAAKLVRFRPGRSVGLVAIFQWIYTAGLHFNSFPPSRLLQPALRPYGYLDPLFLDDRLVLPLRHLRPCAVTRNQPPGCNPRSCPRGRNWKNSETTRHVFRRVPQQSAVVNDGNVLGFLRRGSPALPEIQPTAAKRTRRFSFQP